ncbi:MAG: hypothetical protein O9327_07730 [Polaromonas sp.]|nr:hypothetical protein [Polaromonas sp.]
MKIVKASLLLMLAVLNFACSPGTPALVTYEKSGVSVAHLSNWKVTSDTTSQEGTGFRTIDLEGPHSALVSVLLLPASTGLTLDAFAASIERERASAVKESLSVGSFSAAKISPGSSQAITGEVGGQNQNGIQQKFSVHLLGQEVPHEARFFLVSDQHKKAFILAQVASEHVNQMAPDFSAVLSSFRLANPG